MISLNWNGMEGQIGALMARYAELPRHIAKKHLQAAMKRTVKDGVPVLKRLTPKGGTRTVRAALKRGAGGRFVQGSGKKSRVRGGALRRAVTTKAKYIGRNADGAVYGVVGYRAGFESRKAIWLEFGTSRGVKPQQMIEKFKREYGGPAAGKLAAEMAAALEKAAAELASGMNPTRTFGRGG
jgi:hypothetical protein